METKEFRRETVALARNKLYTTYQFHGYVGKGMDPEDVFCTAISEIALWLKDRFRQFEDIPKQILKLCDCSKSEGDGLKSFRISDGYIIETVYIPEDQLWTFQLTEPDMGTSGRSPVPGRLFMTNFALRIVDNQVEIGCKTVCSQPESMDEDAEVFRPKVVRNLKDKLGLYNLIDLSYEAGDLQQSSYTKKLQTLQNCQNRNMPILIIHRNNLKSMENIMSLNKDFLGGIGNPKIDIQINNAVNWVDTSNDIAKSLCAFAYVFYNMASSETCVEIQYPGGDAKKIEMSDIMNSEQEHSFRRKIIDRIRNYPKRNNQICFGNVIFLQEAIAKKQEKDLERLQKSEDCIAENRNLYKIIERVTEEKTREEQKCRDFAAKYQEEKEKRRSDESSFKDKIRQSLEKAERLEQEKDNLLKRLGAIEKELNVYHIKESRPNDIDSFIKWVEDNFSEDILLLQRAKEELKKTNNVNIALMCDAIEVLSNAYKRWRLSLISEEDFRCGCKSTGSVLFDITPTGNASILKYPKKYKVPYDKCQDINGKRALDMHLKTGVDAKFLIRIYFFWDEESEKVVIGSMPDHLPCV